MSGGPGAAPPASPPASLQLLLGPRDDVVLGLAGEDVEADGDEGAVLGIGDLDERVGSLGDLVGNVVARGANSRDLRVLAVVVVELGVAGEDLAGARSMAT